jgi:hypothetical protein
MSGQKRVILFGRHTGVSTLRYFPSTQLLYIHSAYPTWPPGGGHLPRRALHIKYVQCDVLVTAGIAKRGKFGLVEIPSAAQELMIDSLFKVQSTM